MRLIKNKLQQLKCEHTAEYYKEQESKGFITKYFKCTKCGKVLNYKVKG